MTKTEKLEFEIIKKLKKVKDKTIFPNNNSMNYNSVESIVN